MAPPQAPANGGAGNGSVVVAGGTAASVLEVESNGAGGDHNGVSDNGGGGAAPSVAANGNGKQGAERRRRSKKKKPAVSPKDRYWTPIDGKEAAAALEDGGEDGRRPLLFRTYRVKGILLHPYRCARVVYFRTHPH